MLTLLASAHAAVPTAKVQILNSQLGIGATSVVEIEFSELVTGFANADLTVPNGTLSGVSSADGGITWSATFTPKPGVTQSQNSIALDMTGVISGSGQPGMGMVYSNVFNIDFQRPTSTIVMSNTALKAGDTSQVTITFSEAVWGFDNSDLSVSNGMLSNVYTTDGGITWTATFTPNTGVTDNTNLIVLNNASFADIAGNEGWGTTSSPNYTTNTERPTATIFMSNTALKAGDTSQVTITFSEAVTGFDNADLSVPNGFLSNVSPSNGGVIWTATFTPSGNTDSAMNVITLENSGVQSGSGNAGDGRTDSNNFAIDTMRPTSTIKVANSNLGIGATTTVTITFTEVVAGLSLPDLAVANGTLSNLVSADGGMTWTATLTPTAGINDGTNLILLDNSDVTDSSGNPGSGIGISNSYALDAERPTVKSIVVDQATLKAGDTTLVTFTFSERVTDFDNADLTVPNGTLTPVSSADSGLTWTATFTPTAGTSAPTNVITLAWASITDLAGNTGSGTATSNNYALDTVRPTVTSIVIDKATLKAGDTALVTVTFGEKVTDFENTDLTVPNGALTPVSSSDSGITWTATFTAAQGVNAAANVITLNNAGVQNLAGNVGSGTTDSNNFAIEASASSIAPVPVPVNAPWALAVLSVCFGALVWRRRKT